MHFSESNAFQGIYYSRINARKQANYKWLYNERNAYLPCPSSTHFLSAGATLIAVLFLLLLFLSAVKSAEEWQRSGDRTG